MKGTPKTALQPFRLILNNIGLAMLLFTMAVLPLAAPAATNLVVGDIQILGVTADDADSFTFVLWTNITSGTTIRFTDNSFTSTAGNAFVSGAESDLGINFTTDVTAGSVVKFENGVGLTLPSGVTGSTTGSMNGLAVAGDQLTVYQGSAVSGATFSGRTLLHGFNIADTDWLTTGTADSSNSYLPTAISGADASIDSGNFDNAEYSGTRAGMTVAAYRAAVGNIANYTQNNTRFSLATTSFTNTSSVLLTWDANGTTAGSGGTGTWDLTTQSRFSNSTADTFLHWVNASTGNDHTAVFGGTAGTVTVGSGGVTVSGLKFDVSGYTISGSTITLNASGVPDVAVTTSGHTATISSIIAGSSGMTKSGSGTLHLLADNTYTGATSLNAGALYLNGNNASANGSVSVSSTATLGGTGTVGGDVTVSGTLEPGDPTTNGGVGTLTFVKSSSFGPNSKLVFTMVTPTSSDKVVGSGSGTLTLDAGLQIFLDVSAYAATATAGDVFDLIDWAVPVLPNGFNPDLDITVIGGPLASGLLFEYSNFLSNGTITVVPEPSRLVLILVAMCAAISSRRRKKALPEFGSSVVAPCRCSARHHRSSAFMRSIHLPS